MSIDKPAAGEKHNSEDAQKRCERNEKCWGKKKVNAATEALHVVVIRGTRGHRKQGYGDNASL
jgi:hypothetical protein